MSNRAERDPNEAQDTTAFKAQERQSLMDLYGVGNVNGEEDLFTKIDSDILSAADKDTYRPFFEMTQSSLQSGLRQNINRMKSTGFAGSSGEQTIMDSILADYGSQAGAAYGDMVTKAQQGREKIDDIIRMNQNQAFQLRQMEEA